MIHEVPEIWMSLSQYKHCDINPTLSMIIHDSHVCARVCVCVRACVGVCVCVCACECMHDLATVAEVLALHVS